MRRSRSPLWRRNGWIRPQDPRGWFQWYCRYYMGRRTADDARQIRRWRAIARHVAAIRKHCEQGDLACRRRQRQAVLHWAYDSREKMLTDRPRGKRRTEVSSVPIRIGISSCLLGEDVRFDGGHKRDAFLTETFGPFVEWVPVCPEVEFGLGTPRETMRLVATRRRRAAAHRQDRRRSDRGWTARRGGASRALASEDLSGYVLKKDSPSCGMERVKVYGAHGVPARSGTRTVRRAAASSASPTCRSRKKAGCQIRGCARTSSSACSRTGGCAGCSRHDGTPARWCAFTPRTS